MHIPSLLGSIIFAVGQFLSLLRVFYGVTRSNYDRTLHEELDPNYLIREWNFRTKYQTLDSVSGLLVALGWLFITVTMLELAWVLSRRGTNSVSLHSCIGVFAVIACFTEFVSIAMYMGTIGACESVLQEFDLKNWVGGTMEDDIGVRNLEIIFLVVQGFFLFIGSVEFLCVAFIMTSLHISVRRWRLVDTTSFGVCWNALSLFIGLLALLDFVAAVLQLEDVGPSGQIELVYTVINRIILIPIWLLMVGTRLPRARAKLDEAPGAVA